MRLGPASRALAPGYSWCQKCGTPWKFVNGHTVDFDYTDVTMPDGSVIKDFPFMGHFALCEACWDESDEDERVLLHMQALQRWGDPGDEEKTAKILVGVRRASRERKPHDD